MTFSIQAAAARLLREDPLFRENSETEQEDAAADAIEAAGGKADTLMVGMVVNAALGLPAPKVMPAFGVSKPAYQSLLSQVQIATGLTDPQLAHIIGVSRPTVQIWRSGRGPERLTRAMLEALKVTVTAQREAVERLLTELNERV